MDYPRCTTLNCRCSVDADFQDGAGSVSLLVLPIMHANTSVMTNGNLWPLRLPKMQDQKSFTLRWCSFPGWRRERLSPFFHYEGGHHIQKEHCGTIANILRLIVESLNATINRITQNPDPKIGPHGSSHTRQNPRLDGYRAQFGLPRRCGSGLWTVLELNQTVLVVQTQTASGLPRPVGNTNCGR